MTAETTIKINHADYNRINAASDYLGISRSRLISSLVTFFSTRNPGYLPSRIRVRYKERSDKDCWRRMHLCLRRDEYDFFFDLRIVLKLSVSLIISLAIEQYLDELVSLMKSDTDNYRYRNYAICQLIIDNVTCWVHYWGIPTTLIPQPEPPS